MVDFQVKKYGSATIIGECKHGNNDGLFQLVAAMNRCHAQQGDMHIGE